MTTDLDCYIFIDPSVAEEDRTVSVMCVECRTERMPDTGFFYEGSKEGYSDYNWVCCFCEKMIHEALPDLEEDD